MGRAFSELIARTAQEAKDAGELRADTDIAVLAFELHALGRAANADSVMYGGLEPYRLARTCLRNRVDAASVVTD